MTQHQNPKFKLLLGFSLALLFVLYTSSINPELSDLSGDSARFLLLAKALEQGKGYREIEKPDEPPHTEYMPGLPILLALVYHFSPMNLKPMKFLIMLFAWSSVILFYLLLRREPPLVRWLLAIVFGLLPFLLKFQTQILSDLPHLALLLLAFFWMEKIRETTPAKALSWALAGFFLAGAFYFRQLALIAFLSGIILMFWEKKLRCKKIILSYVLGFILPASLWYLRNLLVAGTLEPSYGTKLWFAKASNPFAGTLTLAELLARILRRSAFFGLHLGKDLLIGSSSQLLRIIWLILLLLFLSGWLRELIKRKNISAIYFFPYLIVVSSWEGWVPRYLLPLLPLTIFFIYKGWEFFLSIFFKNKNQVRWLMSLVFFIWLVFNFYRTISVIVFQHTPLWYPPLDIAEEREAQNLIGRKNFAYYPEAFDWKKKGEQYLLAKSRAYYHFLAMAEWVKQNLGAEAVVLCRKPRLFAWYSQGKAIQLPAELESEKFIAQAKKRKANYLLIEEISPELRPILFSFWQKQPQSFQVEKRLGETYLLKLN